MIKYTEDKLKPAIEAILFTMGQAVSIRTIAEALEITGDMVISAVTGLQEDYEREDRGFHIIRLDDSYQMCTKGEYYDALIRIASQPVKLVLTEVMLEVLSIIAYKQPATRSEIERIRGVSSDHAINRLIEYGLIEEAGRLEAPGRPIVFRTTEEFLRRFGLSSVRDLPAIDESLMAEAATEVYRSEGFAMDGQYMMSFPASGDESEPVIVET